MVNTKHIICLVYYNELSHLIHLKLAVGRFKCASAYIHAYNLFYNV